MAITLRVLARSHTDNQTSLRSFHPCRQVLAGGGLTDGVDQCGAKLHCHDIWSEVYNRRPWFCNGPGTWRDPRSTLRLMTIDAVRRRIDPVTCRRMHQAVHDQW